MVFVLAVEQWTSSTPSAGFWRVHGSTPNQSTWVLWTLRKRSTMFLGESCGGCSESMAYYIYWSIYVPTLTYDHELWVVSERTRSGNTSGQNGLPPQGVWALL